MTLQTEQNALGPSASEKAMLSAIAPQAQPNVKKKKGPKGPNPLSVKKKAPKLELKKTAAAAPPQIEKVDTGKKRKRQEVDDVVLVETGPRPKRRRRHRVGPRGVEGPAV
jgi:U3 small nucleolar RNA-associated protein 23